MGTLHIINQNQAEAREYLMKAHAIFEAKGLMKPLKEVKQKLKINNNQHKLQGADVVAQDAAALESGGDDSPRGARNDSPPRSKSKGKKKGITAVAKKKGKKTVFRNNFVQDKTGDLM